MGITGAVSYTHLVLVEIVLQINGNGPGIPAIILTMAVAGGLAYICLLYTSCPFWYFLQHGISWSEEAMN